MQQDFLLSFAVQHSLCPPPKYVAKNEESVWDVYTLLANIFLGFGSFAA